MNISSFRRRWIVLLAGMFAAAGNTSAALPIDLTKPAPPFTELRLNQGSNRDPQGHTLTADSQSLLLDGKPFVSVSGEFHYGRYARAEWRDELLKMKAGGLTTVSTYVFWIYHEEEQGRWDWTGQRSLREFIQLAQEVGLKVVLRCGPWAHGEARNGGFPDWVQNSHTKLRTNDPAFMTLVRPYYQQIAEQTRGLYWKDGGPIFAVQVDNEIDNPEYLLALKALAREVGIDAPFYIMTGWGGVRIPKQDLLPVFGAYAWAFWGKGEPGLASFVFTTGRNTRDMGAQPAPNALTPAPANAGAPSPTPAAPPAATPPPVLDPYLTGELGGGMASSYVHRVAVDPDDVAAVNLVRLGDGNTMPGFYMYQGGINPDGKLSFLNEAKPNPLPPKNYDFEAPLGACGEVRGHYHLLREQNLFVQFFGPELLRMRAFMSSHGSGVNDVESVRWAVRWKDDAGFLLFNNYAPVLAFHDHPGTQFELQTAKGIEKVPAEPVTIPVNEYGLWPLHLDCHGAALQYATAQPICYADQEKDRWYFFKAIPGIDPDFVFDRKGVRLTVGKEDASTAAGTLRLRHLVPGTGEAFVLTKDDGSAIHFVILGAEQSRTLYCAPFAGRDRVILSKATVLADGGGIRLQTGAAADFSFAVFPPVSAVASSAGNFVRSMDGAFARFTPTGLSDPKPVQVQMEQIHPASTGQPELPGTDEDAWKNAAVWKVSVPPEAAGRHLLVQVHYLADAARLYAGDAFLDDNDYNSRPFDFGLWRVPQNQWDRLTLKILPYTPALLDRLQDAVRQKVAATDPAEQNRVTATVTEQIELKIMPPTAP